MIRVAIIGSGFGLYGLLPAFLATKGCEVVAICGNQSPRLLSYCQQEGINRLYTSWQDMLAMEEFDAVAIAVPPDAQYEIAKAAIKKRLHIFAEKPLTATKAQAVKLAALAEKAEITTAVDFIFPEIEEWKIVKKIISTRRYGKLLHLDASWDFLSYDLKNKITTWKTDEQKGGGALAFFGSHVLHNIRFFAGDYTLSKSHIVHSKESINGGDVGFDAMFATEGGATGQVHLRCNTKGLHSHSYTFLFEKATIILESQQAVTSSFKVTLHTTKAIKNLNHASKRAAKNEEDERVHEVRQLTQRFIKACQKGIPMTPSFTDGLYVQNQIQQVRRKVGL